ncbi:threonine-phosphate decarboxylase CobD [Domibacillus robiginosus]|uniref:threonine-phosphate decarboxylase CobD n=1 Tax=Domibacillus robiginosus TaxID=1071054 RepID=UPI00067DC374|nr:threonine-phosphate decarboxylase CobD [Domibacillus robiginosus]
MRLPSHGANPIHLYEASGIKKPEHTIDFSVNTNPHGPPRWLREAWPSFFEAVEGYPDPSGKAAKESIASRFSISTENLLLGNGAAEIIHFIARRAAGRKAVIVTPAFSEYEDACRAYDCAIQHVPVAPENWVLPVEELVEQAKEAAVLFLCTPNNPTGQVFQKKELLALLQQTRTLGTLIVIDEAFYDFNSSESFISELASFPHLAVLHSMTKMYAVAGLRIGYVAASQETIRELSRYQPHWNVNAIALQTAEKIARDTAHADKTRKWMEKERQWVINEIVQAGYTVLPSAVNFYLMKDPAIDDQTPLLHFLLERGIVLRHTENFHGLDGKWLRSAVKGKVENEQLLMALTEWKKP